MTEPSEATVNGCRADRRVLPLVATSCTMRTSWSGLAVCLGERPEISSLPPSHPGSNISASRSPERPCRPAPSDLATRKRTRVSPQSKPRRALGDAVERVQPATTTRKRTSQPTCPLPELASGCARCLAGQPVESVQRENAVNYGQEGGSTVTCSASNPLHGAAARPHPTSLAADRGRVSAPAVFSGPGCWLPAWSSPPQCWDRRDDA